MAWRQIAQVRDEADRFGLQHRQHFRHALLAHLGGGQLNSQGQPIQQLAQPNDVPDVLWGQGEVNAGLPGALVKEGDGVEMPALRQFNINSARRRQPRHR